MPIAYIPRTRERYRNYPAYRWVVNHDAPWTPLTKPIRQCRVALVSSGGFYAKGQPSFVDNDPVVPSGADGDEARGPADLSPRIPGR